MSSQDAAVRAALTPKIQTIGKKLVAQLYMVLRTSRIHDASNTALLVATENLKDTINTLWAALGEIRLQFIEELVYLNDVRLRVDAGNAAQLKDLQQIFEARGLGGLAFSRPVDTIALRDFLVLLGRPVESEDDIREFRHALQELKELALELLGPRTFADDPDEVRIDKKTFALQTYAKLLVAARETTEALRAGQDPFVGKLHVLRIVQDLVDIATERVNFLLRVSAIKSAIDYPFNHAANTCVLSLVIGKALGVDRLQLVDLGLAAFFADVGYRLLPEETLARAERLEPGEVQALRDQAGRSVRRLLGDPRLGSSMIRRAIVAYEHHRPLVDAEGRPQDLHTFSRIVAVAGAYDALTTKRPWREGYPPDEALKLMMGEAGSRFDPTMVKLLVNLLGLYPLGSAVKLDSGEVAVVYHNSNDPKLFEKPWVKVLRDASGARVKKTVIRNLAEHDGEGGRIVSSVPAAELEGLDPAMVIAV
jgi:HD-GYP domain-containing protein (c-di-GMP phosphodiesterase class II)